MRPTFYRGAEKEQENFSNIISINQSVFIYVFFCCCWVVVFVFFYIPCKVSFIYFKKRVAERASLCSALVHVHLFSSSGNTQSMTLLGEVPAVRSLSQRVHTKPFKRKTQSLQKKTKIYKAAAGEEDTNLAHLKFSTTAQQKDSGGELCITRE